MCPDLQAVMLAADRRANLSVTSIRFGEVA